MSPYYCDIYHSSFTFIVRNLAETNQKEREAVMMNAKKSLAQFGEVKGSLEERMSRWEVRNFKKGTQLLREGQVCDTGFHIVKGMLRVFYIVGGKEVTSRFAEEGDACISYESFYTQTPSHEYIDVIDEATITMIPYAELQDIYEKYPEMNRLMRVGMEQSHIKSEIRARIIRSLPAHERYLEMKKLYPNVFHKATTEQIASMLGIQRETLSRIIGKERQNDAEALKEQEDFRNAVEKGGMPI